MKHAERRRECGMLSSDAQENWNATHSDRIYAQAELCANWWILKPKSRPEFSQKISSAVNPIYKPTTSQKAH